MRFFKFLKLNKKQIIKHLNVVIWLIVLVMVIYSAYSMGVVYGIIVGFGEGLEKYNSSLCELFKERDSKVYVDSEGYCVIAQCISDIKHECTWGKIRIEGNRSMYWYEKVAYFPQKVFNYPALRCW